MMKKRVEVKQKILTKGCQSFQLISTFRSVKIIIDVDPQ